MVRGRPALVRRNAPVVRVGRLTRVVFIAHNAMQDWRQKQLGLAPIIAPAVADRTPRRGNGDRRTPAFH
jgi:hypothetical protein